MKRPPLITDAQWENVLRGGFDGERVLLLMAWLADRQQVRESGTNRGEWVERFLASTGLGPGNPWCAAVLNYCCEAVDAPCPSSGAAAVRNWVSWARQEGKLIPIGEAKRGDLVFWLHDNGTGHIGIVVDARNGRVWTIEGNTSSGVRGSQRDGDGLYRRTRFLNTFEGAIRL